MLVLFFFVRTCAIGLKGMGMLYYNAIRKEVLMPVSSIVKQHQTKRKNHQKKNPSLNHIILKTLNGITIILI